MKVSTCPEFWKDFKKLKTPLAKFEDSVLSEQLMNDYDKLQCSKLTTAITDFILNSVSEKRLDLEAIKNGKQPFLQNGWTIYKLKFAIDNRGKSGGLRIVFCKNHDYLLLVLIKHKKNCTNEPKLQSEFISRIKQYICL